MSSPDRSEAAWLTGDARAVAVGVVGAVLSFFVFRGAEHTTSDPADAIPQGSFLAATVDVAELRRSPVHDVVFGQGGLTAPKLLGGRTLPLRDMTEACGFDPLSRVQRLAVAVPEDEDSGEIGVAARVTVTADEVSSCARALAAERGGGVDTSQRGGFVVAADHSAKGLSRPKLAYGEGGLLVVARGDWFDEMLGSAVGERPSLRASPEHAALRASLTSRAGFKSPTVLVTAVLPRSLRDRLKGEMAGEAKDGSASVMAGVLGVSAVGFAMKLGPAGGRVEAAVELVCDDAPGCVAVERLIAKKRFDWSKDLSLRLVGLGSLLDSIAIERSEAKGPRIHVTAGADASALAATLERVLRLRSRLGGRDEEPGPVRGTEQAPAPPASSAAADSGP